MNSLTLKAPDIHVKASKRVRWSLRYTTGKSGFVLKGEYDNFKTIDDVTELLLNKVVGL